MKKVNGYVSFVLHAHLPFVHHPESEDYLEEQWLFEAISALATVGLTAGITPTLGIPAQILIIAFMYFGRVGVLTISLGFLMGNKAEDRFRYADTNLLIG